MLLLLLLLLLLLSLSLGLGGLHLGNQLSLVLRLGRLGRLRWGLRLLLGIWLRRLALGGRSRRRRSPVSHRAGARLRSRRLLLWLARWWLLGGGLRGLLSWRLLLRLSGLGCLCCLLGLLGLLGLLSLLGVLGLCCMLRCCLLLGRCCLLGLLLLLGMLSLLLLLGLNGRDLGLMEVDMLRIHRVLVRVASLLPQLYLLLLLHRDLLCEHIGLSLSVSRSFVSRTYASWTQIMRLNAAEVALRSWVGPVAVERAEHVGCEEGKLPASSRPSQPSGQPGQSSSDPWAHPSALPPCFDTRPAGPSGPVSSAADVAAAGASAVASAVAEPGYSRRRLGAAVSTRPGALAMAVRYVHIWFIWG